MAAGPWYTSSGLGDSNIAVAPRALILALADTVKNRVVAGHPIMQALMATDPMMRQILQGALGSSVGLVTAGTSKLAATAEGTEATPTDFTVSNSTTVSPARLAHARRISDFGVSTQAGLLQGEIGPDAVALMVYDGYMAYINKMIDLLVATFTSATYTIGSAGTSISWGALNDGIIAMKNRGLASGGLGFLSATGAQALSNDMLGLGGAVQWSPGAQQGISSLKKGAYVASLWDVDFFLSSELDSSGGDTYGGIITEGSHKVEHRRVPLGVGAQVVYDLDFLTAEARRPGGGVSTVEMVSHFGLAIQEQTRFAALIGA